MEKILYPGSFRPFHKGHLNNVFLIRSLFPKSKIIIGVNSMCKRADTLIDSMDTSKLIHSVVDDIGVDDVDVMIVKKDIVNGTRFLINNKINIVFSGSKSTTTVMSCLKFLGLWNGKIYKLLNAGIHGTDIRAMIKNGNDDWKRFVPKSEWKVLRHKQAKFIDSLR